MSKTRNVGDAAWPLEHVSEERHNNNILVAKLRAFSSSLSDQRFQARSHNNTPAALDGASENCRGAALCGSSFAILLGYLVSVYAIRTGDVSFTAQFRYIGLIAALILGYVFFGEWPDRLALIGAAIIVGTGAFTLYRQRASRKVKPA